MSASLLVIAATITIQQCFNGLVGDLDGFILTASIFALAWAGFLFAFSVDNENRGRAAAEQAVAIIEVSGTDFACPLYCA